MAELTAEALTKIYGGARVVDEVSFSVPSGAFFALLGPSGSGKTTILRMLSGFAQPDGGRVLVDGEDLTDVAPERRHMGVVFQSYALFPHMTAWHNVAFGLLAQGVPPAETARRVRDAVALTHLDGLEGRRPGQLSGGQQQRVALARALVVRPRLLLLDEPLSALDTRIRVEMRGELRRIQRESGVTAVIVTHDQEEAMELADAMLVLDSGRSVQEGTPREVYSQPRSGGVAAFMGRSNTFLGTAALAADGACTVRGPAGLTWRLVGASPRGVSAAQGAVRIAFRPECVALQPLGAPVDPRDPSGGGGDAVGEVLAVRFEGPVTRVSVRADGALVESLLLSRQAEGIAQGQAVRLFVAARHVHVFPADGMGGEAQHGTA